MATEIHQIGPYVLGKQLGSGGFASVREATHESTGERVAIKVIERSSLNPDGQIRSEISLCKKLASCDNIVRYKAHFVTEEAVYLALELVTGGELYDRLEQAGKFSEDKAREYFAQLLDGVEACHAVGVCHRDLKLENVLMDTDGSIKITDFGFSKLFTQGSPRTVVGTALYVAPEVVLQDGGEYSGVAADIWSLGIILYLLTVGRFPFNRGHIGGVAPGMSRSAKERFRNDNFRAMSHMSPPLVGLLRRVLCADPARRANIAEIRQHEWFTGVQDSGTPGGATRPGAAVATSPASTPPRPPTAARLHTGGHVPPVEIEGEDAPEVEWEVISPTLKAPNSADPYSSFRAGGFDDLDTESEEEEDDEPWESESEREGQWHRERAEQAQHGGAAATEAAVESMGTLAVSVPAPPS